MSVRGSSPHRAQAPVDSLFHRAWHSRHIPENRRARQAVHLNGPANPNTSTVLLDGRVAALELELLQTCVEELLKLSRVGHLL